MLLMRSTVAAELLLCCGTPADLADDEIDPLGIGIAVRETPEQHHLRKRVFLLDTFAWCATVASCYWQSSNVWRAPHQICQASSMTGCSACERK